MRQPAACLFLLTLLACSEKASRSDIAHPQLDWLGGIAPWAGAGALKPAWRIEVESWMSPVVIGNQVLIESKNGNFLVNAETGERRPLLGDEKHTEPVRDDFGHRRVATLQTEMSPQAFGGPRMRIDAFTLPDGQKLWTRSPDTNDPDCSWWLVELASNPPCPAGTWCNQEQLGTTTVSSMVIESRCPSMWWKIADHVPWFLHFLMPDFDEWTVSLIGLEPTTGDVVWEKQVGTEYEQVGCGDHRRSSFIEADSKRVYVRGMRDSDELNVYDRKDGTLLWRRKLDSPGGHVGLTAAGPLIWLEERHGLPTPYLAATGEKVNESSEFKELFRNFFPQWRHRFPDRKFDLDWSAPEERKFIEFAVDAIYVGLNGKRIEVLDPGSLKVQATLVHAFGPESRDIPVGRDSNGRSHVAAWTGALPTGEPILLTYDGLTLIGWRRGGP